METLDKPSAGALEESRVLASSLWAWAALIAAVASAAGSLALTLYEGKQPCPLCYYQRTFALSLVAVLGVGLFTGAVRSARLALLALPLALGGLGVAAFHVSLEVRDVLECPAGLFGAATAPKQSLVLFFLVAVLLGASVWSRLRVREVGFLGTAVALALGGGLVWASISANPKPPSPPTKPYDAPPVICRPPYHASDLK